MLNDQEFINKIKDELEKHGNLTKAVESLGEGYNYNTVYQRIRLLGYKIEFKREAKLVPIHAQDAA